MTLKILHVADIHLKEVGDERWKALLHILEVAKAKNVDVLTISGDLFDKDNRGVQLENPARDLFNGVACKVIVVPGNHDKKIVSSSKFLGKSVQVIDSIQQHVTIGGVHFWGFPFEDMDVTGVASLVDEISKVARGIEGTHVLLYHGELVEGGYYSRGELGDEGSEYRYMPIKLTALARTPFSYVLAGHLHARFFKTEYAAGRYFVYPGSPVSITTKETTERHAALVDLVNPPEPVPLDTFHYKSLEINLEPADIQPVEKIIASIAATRPSAIIFLSVKGYIDAKRVGLNEKELSEKIIALKQRFVEAKDPRRIEQLDVNIKDISKIVSNPLYTRFKAVLDAREVPSPVKARANTQVIDALREVLP